MVTRIVLLFLFLFGYTHICAQTTASFTTPDTVCVNTSVTITNTTVSATSYYWNFCVADINAAPAALNIGNPGNQLNGPVFMDYAYDNGNYYGFVVNFYTAGLIRLNYGNSLLNTPTAVNLGNYGGLLQNSGSEGIQVVQNEGNWYALIVGGSPIAGNQPRIVKIDFGTNITSPGTATNWGNIGNMDQPVDLHVFKEGANWYGFTINAEGNTITRFDFTNSFNNTPTAVNLGNIGGLLYPTGIYAINDNGFWRVFITNAGDNRRDGTQSSLTRLDFGNSLLNTPTGVNLGNPGGILHHPRDLTIMKFCGQVIGFAVNGNPNYNDLVRLNFNNDLTTAPTITSLGNTGNLNFPHSISKLFRANDDVYAFITNVANNTITRLRFAGCTNASVSSSSLKDPQPVSYSTPGTYNINLTIDDGLPTQSSFCKQVVVIPPLVHTPAQTINYCAGGSVKIGTGVKNAQYTWNTGATTDSIVVNTPGIYWVQTDRFGCTNRDSMVVSPHVPTADFTYKQDVCNPLITQFFGVGNLINPNWAFGDGNTATGSVNATNTYAAFGNYTVKFGVETNGCKDTITKNIDINVTQSDVVITPDTTICANTSVQLRAQPALSFCWSPTATLTNANTPTPIATPLQNTTYYYTAEVTGSNLVVNGNFNSGNTGFTSQYIYRTPNFGEGEYFVTNNPRGWNTLLGSCTDHTTGNGNMLLVNGATQANVKVWTQTINVTPNTNYAFSAWLQNVNVNNTGSNPPRLQFSINGNNIGNILQGRNAMCIWDQFYSVWNSGNNTTATISIVNQNTVASGNDYALDDIQFAELTMLRDSVKVTIVPKPVVNLGADAASCSVNNTVLDAGNPGATYLWQDGSTSQTFTATGFGKYYVRVTNGGTCVSADTINLTRTPFTPADFSFKQDICNPLAVQFSPVGNNFTNPYWNFGDGNIITGNPNPPHTFAAFGNYTVKFGIETGGCKDTVTKTISINVTDSDIIFTPDTTICMNTSAQLRAQPALSFCWSPTTWLSNPNIPNPLTTTPEKITYYYTAEVPGNNLIVNGNFSNGNTAVGSSYAYNTRNIGEGEYTVGANPQVWNGFMAGCQDHTGGNGNMLIVNGAAQPNVKVWSQSIPIQPNTNYAFSAWLQNVNVNNTGSNPPRLQFSINGVPIGNIFQSGYTACAWDQFYIVWNSGNNTNAAISIVNQNTVQAGNDFALDDISFAPVSILRDSVVITIDTPVVKTNQDTTICKFNPVPLQAIGATSWLWAPATGLSDATIPNPVAKPLTNTQYIVTGTTLRGCVAKDTVQINLYTQPSVNLGPDIIDCQVNNLVLDAGYAGYNYLWQDGSTAQTFTAILFGKYYVQVTDANGCTNSDTINITKTLNRLGDFTFKTDACNPLSVQFVGAGANLQNPIWSFGDGTSTTGNFSPTHLYPALGDYTVKFGMESGNCKDTITRIISVRVAYSDLIITPDTTLCFNTTKQLRTRPVLSGCWSPATWLNNPNTPNPVTSTPGKFTYYYTAQVPGNNLVTNGDFSAGNTGFTSNYRYSTSNTVEGEYNVGPNPQAWNTLLGACQDHTSGSGYMLLVNGAAQANVQVWTQTITVQPNTDYAFSAWLQNSNTNDASSNPPVLQFSINSNNIGNILRGRNTMCIWDQFYTIWNSGNNTTATISIVNQNTIRAGNDFSLDDISFAPVIIQRDSVIISVDTPVVKTINDTTLCLDSNLPLQATGAATWLWSPATGLSSTTIPNPVATLHMATDYIVTGTTLNGCIASDTVKVSLFPVPVILTDHDTLICPNTAIQLLANPALVSYAWSPAVSLNNPAIANPIATPAYSTVYTVKVTGDHNCSYTDSVNVHMRVIKFMATSLDRTVCKGASVLLTATGGDTYLWSPAGSLDNAAQSSPRATPDTSTVYSVYMAENKCNRDTTIKVIITVNPSPIVTAEKANDLDCITHTTRLNATGTPGNAYQWSPTSGLDHPDMPNPVSTTDTTITYVVAGTKNGCSTLDSVIVYVTSTGKVSFEVPNAFTPNGDGRNDCLGMKSWGGVQLEEFSIFNRWGQRVFTSNNANPCWDGRFRGEPQPAGGYVYVIKAKTYCGSVKRTGMVMLIR